MDYRSTKSKNALTQKIVFSDPFVKHTLCFQNPLPLLPTALNWNLYPHHLVSNSDRFAFGMMKIRRVSAAKITRRPHLMFLCSPGMWRLTIDWGHITFIQQLKSIELQIGPIKLWEMSIVTMELIMLECTHLALCTGRKWVAYKRGEKRKAEEGQKRTTGFTGKTEKLMNIIFFITLHSRDTVDR